MRLFKHFKHLPNRTLRPVYTLAAASTLTLLAAGASLAQSPAPADAPPIAAAPARVSSAEVNAAFDRADENHDARLDRAEAARFPAVAARFDQIDSNHDAYISREEFTKAVMGTS